MKIKILVYHKTSPNLLKKKDSKYLEEYQLELQKFKKTLGFQKK